MEWLKKRFKSKSIKFLSITPSILAFILMYEDNFRAILQEYFEYVLLFFAGCAWILREMTNESLDDK